MRLAGWVVRVFLLITAPVYYLCRFVAKGMSRLDDWSWRAIHAGDAKKPPQSETAESTQQNARRTV